MFDPPQDQNLFPAERSNFNSHFLNQSTNSVFTNNVNNLSSYHRPGRVFFKANRVNVVNNAPLSANSDSVAFPSNNYSSLISPAMNSQPYVPKRKREFSRKEARISSLSQSVSLFSSKSTSSTPKSSSKNVQTHNFSRTAARAAETNSAGVNSFSTNRQKNSTRKIFRDPLHQAISVIEDFEPVEPELIMQLLEKTKDPSTIPKKKKKVNANNTHVEAHDSRIPTLKKKHNPEEVQKYMVKQGHLREAQKKKELEERMMKENAVKSNLDALREFQLKQRAQVEEKMRQKREKELLAMIEEKKKLDAEAKINLVNDYVEKTTEPENFDVPMETPDSKFKASDIVSEIDDFILNSLHTSSIPTISPLPVFSTSLPLKLPHKVSIDEINNSDSLDITSLSSHGIITLSGEKNHTIKQKSEHGPQSAEIQALAQRIDELQYRLEKNLTTYPVASIPEQYHINDQSTKIQIEDEISWNLSEVGVTSLNEFNILRRTDQRRDMAARKIQQAMRAWYSRVKSQRYRAATKIEIKRGKSLENPLHYKSNQLNPITVPSKSEDISGNFDEPERDSSKYDFKYTNANNPINITPIDNSKFILPVLPKPIDQYSMVNVFTQQFGNFFNKEQLHENQTDKIKLEIPKTTSSSSSVDHSGQSSKDKLLSVTLSAMPTYISDVISTDERSKDQVTEINKYKDEAFELFDKFKSNHSSIDISHVSVVEERLNSSFDIYSQQSEHSISCVINEYQSQSPQTDSLITENLAPEYGSSLDSKMEPKITPYHTKEEIDYKVEMDLDSESLSPLKVYPKFSSDGLKESDILTVNSRIHTKLLNINRRLESDTELLSFQKKRTSDESRIESARSAGLSELSRRLSPETLGRKMTIELNILDAIEESRHQLAEIEKLRELAIAQQETAAYSYVFNDYVFHLHSPSLTTVLIERDRNIANELNAARLARYEYGMFNTSNIDSKYEIQEPENEPKNLNFETVHQKNMTNIHQKEVPEYAAEDFEQYSGFETYEDDVIKEELPDQEIFDEVHDVSEKFSESGFNDYERYHPMTSDNVIDNI
ncbi:hypothetical protein HK096_003214, partial [Nowakowskiella sp. JEL0078]